MAPCVLRSCCVAAGSLPHVMTAAPGEAGAAHQWGALDETMQCETPSERRMLDISSMRVS